MQYGLQKDFIQTSQINVVQLEHRQSYMLARMHARVYSLFHSRSSGLWFIPKILICFVRTVCVHDKAAIKVLQLKLHAGQGIVILLGQRPSPCALIVLYKAACYH